MSGEGIQTGEEDATVEALFVAFRTSQRCCWCGGGGGGVGGTRIAQGAEERW